MPLTEGREWSYSVKSGFQNNVVTLKVTDKVNVGDYNGSILSSPIGESRLAWAASTLLASQFANSRFNPPVPILNESKIPPKKKTRDNEFVQVDTWKGRIESFGKSRVATGRLLQRRSTVGLITGQVSAVETVLELTIDKSVIEVRTWFERGKGIVRQEQRTERNQVVSLELLNSK